MPNKDIEKFVIETMNQIQSGVPKGCMLNHEINFDISLITTKNVKGKFDIHIAGISGDIDKQQVHRVKFSIIDEQSREKNIKQLREAIRGLVQEFKELDRLEEKTTKKKR